ncbi:MAG TPA: hypothetical protein VMW62_14400 [Chloroflexota bacterium]|nr:hypothetical protein [Chloroflexota bacterium]
MSYGSRARIGYTCPIYLAEIFPYDFYKMVPRHLGSPGIRPGSRPRLT